MRKIFHLLSRFDSICTETSRRRSSSRAPRQTSRCVHGLERLEDRTVLAAGVLDPSFGIGGKVLTDFGYIETVTFDAAQAVQVDGKTVVAGPVGECLRGRSIECGRQSG